MAASFSFLQIGCFVYDQPLTRLYRAEPALAHAGLAEQTARLEAEGLMPVLGMARAMAKRGHRVNEHHFSLISLQAAWAREHLGGSRLCHTTAERMEVAIAQARQTRPDVVYIQGLNALPPTFMADLRDACPSIRVAVGHVGSAFTPGHLRGYDVVFGCVPGIAATVTAAGMPGGVMYHAIDADSFRDCDANRPRSYPFTFTGSSGHGLAKTHGSRHDALRTLIRDTELNCWLYDFDRQKEGLCSQPSLSALAPDRVHGALFGVPMVRLLADSQITFNFHSAEAAGDAGNIRLFEATAAGACLLTDGGRNLADLFSPDDEVAVYHSLDECREKVRHLLDHPEERVAIAAAGRRRALACHTYEQRAEELEPWIRRLL